MILEGAERDRVLAVAEREERNFLAGQELFDDYAIAGRAEVPAFHRVRDRFQSRRRVVADDDAFAERESVGLDDHRARARLHVAAGGFGVVECGEVGGRHARLAHDRLGERLAGFELGRGRGRPEDFQSGACEVIDDSGGKDVLRTDDRQIDRF